MLTKFEERRAWSRLRRRQGAYVVPPCLVHMTKNWEMQANMADSSGFAALARVVRVALNHVEKGVLINHSEVDIFINRNIEKGEKS